MKMGNNIFISSLVSINNYDYLGKFGFKEYFIVGAVFESDFSIRSGEIIFPEKTIGHSSIIGVGTIINKKINRHLFYVGISSKYIFKSN
jgi:acetyltransferase-like isoleucine patch superfamily enzyme